MENGNSKLEIRNSKINNRLPPLLPTRYSLLPLLSCEIGNQQSAIGNGIIAVLCHHHARWCTNGINKIEASKARFGFPTGSFI